MSPPRPWRVAWITGASSGIGRELALKLARTGVLVAASARSAERLAELAAQQTGIIPVPLDITDRAACTAAHDEIATRLGPVDLAILNAGIWHPMGAHTFDAALVERAMAVNYQGTANVLEPLLRAMIARRGGHIALVSSVAGLRGLPNSASYSPTKASLISLAECLRHDVEQHGITISIVNPGFVDTPMTRINRFPMPFIMPPGEAADRILSALARRRYDITFPLPMAILMKLARLAPSTLFFWAWRTFVTPRR